MSQSDQAVLAAVRKRLAQEPERILPALRVIADPDALIDEGDESTVSLARVVNVHRVVAGLREFRAHAYGTEEVRALLGGVSRQAVSQRVRNSRLLAMEISGKSWFPDWQFAAGRPVAGLAAVIALLRELGEDAYSADGIVRTALPEEGGRTIADLLRAGQTELALHYVRAVGGGF